MVPSGCTKSCFNPSRAAATMLISPTRHSESTHAPAPAPAPAPSTRRPAASACHARDQPAPTLAHSPEI
eukprot:3172652-Rhodomonas_salina.1